MPPPPNIDPFGRMPREMTTSDEEMYPYEDRDRNQDEDYYTSGDEYDYTGSEDEGDEGNEEGNESLSRVKENETA